MVPFLFIAMALTADGGPAPAPAAMTHEVKQLVDRMQGFYEKTQDFTANFKQEYRYKTFARTQTSTGKVTYAKAKGAEPTRMRWDYDQPKKVFLLSGEKAYFYDPDAATLNIVPIATNQLSASVTFLWGKGKLENEFAISQVPCPKCAGTQLQLEPLKPDPRFQRVFLEIDPKSATVLRSTVIDPEGNSNAITFTDLKTNVGVAASKDGGVPEVFRLSPPAGTQIVDMTRK